MPTLVHLWIAATAVCAGAVAGATAGGGPFVVGALVGACGLAARRRGLRVAALAMTALCLAGFSAALRDPGEDALARLARSVPSCEVVGAIAEQGALGTVVRVRRARCEPPSRTVVGGRIVVDGDRGGNAEILVARGTLVPLGRDPFDRARRRRGATAALVAAQVRVAPPSGGVAAVAARVRRGLRRSVAILAPEDGALLRGLAIGDTRSFNAATLETFRRSGLSHLLAVSGTNVAIVVGVIAYAFRRVGLFARIGLSLAALALFVVVVGPEPSVLRAAVMGGLTVVALFWGTRVHPLNGLALAVIAVVGARPEMVFSVGLHLSVAATAGIVLWATPMADRLGSLPRPLGLALGVTLGAQVAVAPILAGVFGQLSLVAPVANLLAVPAVGPATVLSLAAGACGAVMPVAGRALARLAAPFASWIVWVGERLGEPAWAAVDVPRWTGLVLALPVGIAAIAALKRAAA